MSEFYVAAELASLKDETPITNEWLNEKFWFDTNL